MSILRLLCVGFVLLLIGAAPASAQIKMFLCSADVPGESNDASFTDCTNLIAVGERIVFLPDGADKMAKAIELLPIELQKAVDLGSPVLRKLALTKQPFEGRIIFRRDSGDGNFVFLEIDFLGARVANIGLTENGPTTTESFTIVPERVTWTYTSQNDDHSAGEKTEFSWDVESGESL